MSFGRPYILGIDGCIHDGWLVIRDNNNYFNKSFLYYVLGSPNMYREFNRLAVGGVVNNLNTKLVQGVTVAIPPLAEQERIVAELDLLQGIIDKQKAQLKELDTLAQSIFYDMFGDPVENEKGWTIKRLKEACAVITDGTHNSPISTEWGDFKYITAKNIKKDGFDFKGLTYVSASVHKEIYARCAPQFGDVLFIKDGATTGVAMINTLHEEFSLLSSVALIKPGTLLCNRYLRDFLDHPSTYRSVRNNMGGAAITRLTLSKIGELLISLPPLSLQQSYATKIEAIERQKASINASVAETQKLFDYTMDKYFG